jgi:hypothetical protein
MSSVLHHTHAVASAHALLAMPRSITAQTQQRDLTPAREWYNERKIAYFAISEVCARSSSHTTAAAGDVELSASVSGSTVQR